LLLCGAVLLFSQSMTPRSWVSGAGSAWNYLITQPYVALLYLKAFFWPSGISADYDVLPFTTTNDVRFWAGFAFIVTITTITITACIFKRTRVIGFGLVWFIVALLPTSLFPLAEVMNDHRALLSYGGLVTAFAGAISLLLNRGVRFAMVAKVATACVVVLFLAANGYATWQRNKVWKTEESLWHDVAVKSPPKPPGLMSY